jgi:hypothetical protein
MRSRIREPEAALSIPPPRSYESDRLRYLVEQRYLSLETVEFDIEEIPTKEFRSVRHEIGETEIKSLSHADLKAVAAWFLRQRGSRKITYEERYPESARIADVASIQTGEYVEVGQVEDVTRVYETLGLDVVSRGGVVTTVLRRHPESNDPTKRGSVRAVLSVPFPAKDEHSREWERDLLAVHRYTLGSRTVSTPNRRHCWWGEER